MLLGVVTIFGVSAGVALGAKHHHHHHVVRCKPKNTTSTCLGPNVSSNQISAKCKKAGTKVVVPVITVTANAGIKKITVVLVDPKTLKKFSFKKPGPLTKKIRGLRIDTKGFKHGVFTIKISVTDQRGKHKSITRRFAVCKPVPVFTG